MNSNINTNVFVALSGGVDSAVTAYLLKSQGYNVTGVFMKNWSGEDFGIQDECPWEKDQQDAENVCKHLTIPFMTYNFEKEYRKDVIEYFFSQYKAGKTPNPDVMCNQTIKFGAFLNKAIEQGADLIATGHYAKRSLTHNLLRAKDQNKDQTYFLYRLTKDQLGKSLFPLGDLTKIQVREIASKQQLPVAEKRDSQGICFVGKIDTQNFLQTEIKPKKGDIIDIDTENKVGEHNGSWFYTLGQREGLKIGGASKPYFVAKKDTSENILYVASGKDNPALYQDKYILEDIHWISGNKPTEEILTSNDLQAMARYRQKPLACKFIDDQVIFDKPIWQAAPGQSVILIYKDKILGGGIVT